MLVISCVWRVSYYWLMGWERPREWEKEERGGDRDDFPDTLYEKPLDKYTLNWLIEEVPFIESPYKIYVGILAKTITTKTLKKKFLEKGNVLDAKFICIPQTRKSCGYGFISFPLEANMEAAISSFSNALSFQSPYLTLHL